ncbi:MAG: stage III sporulation protein AE [Clostridia bacterium]|nr:stage III sporulation protein AE [Clostridia bacterium]
MRKLLVFLIFAAVLASPCLASGQLGVQSESYGVSEVEENLPDAAREILGDALVEDAADTDAFIKRIWENAKEKAGGIWADGVKSALAIAAVALLCGLIYTMTESGTAQYITLGGVAAIAVIAVGDAGAFIPKGVAALQTISDFSRALLPCLCASAAAGGAFTSAAAKYAATALFVDIFITAAQTVILPLIYAYLAASIAAAAMDSPALESAAGLMKWLCVALMTLLVTAFTAYLSLSGAITGAADALTSKAAKAAISAALPVVGGIVSDAAETVVAGAGLVRSSVGVFGLLAVLCVCLVPFLTLGVHYMLYKAAAALAGAFADKRLSSLISAVGSAFGMVLGMVGSGAIMLFISVISLIKAVSG